MPYVAYRADVEQLLPDEDELLGQLDTLMVDLAKRVRDERGHAFHGTHAKLTGLAAATFEVLPGLPDELSQGLFASPRTYDAIVRLASGPPEPVSDKASGQQGFAVKVLGVEGDRLQGSDDRTQDWVLGLDPSFTASDARAFQGVFQVTGAQSPHLNSRGIEAMSLLARGVEAGLEAVGTESANLRFFGRPPVHPLAASYYTQAAIRYGDYIAKLAVFPTAQTLEAIDEQAASLHEDDANREAVIGLLQTNEATFDVRVQLCTDLASMPVEDASVAWPEDESPYRSVARLTLPPQDPFSPARRAYDDHLAFNPSHCLRAHRPLGSIMRARSSAYRAVQRYRQAENRTGGAEPVSANDLPA